MNLIRHFHVLDRSIKNIFFVPFIREEQQELSGFNMLVSAWLVQQKFE